MSDYKVIKQSIDGNTAAARVAHAMSEVIAIYPITPSSPMGELADALSVKGEKNIFGQIPRVYEMQSEGGASGAVHGAAASGSLTTTFTASQGLLLMIPNMYKLAGELTPTVFHVSARSVATHALSIFGDHSDVMATRQTGFAMIASANQQEIQDLATISHAATVEAKVPILHFFDGFRTSHEIRKVELVPKEVMKEMIEMKYVYEMRKRALNPDYPTLRGTAENPDIFFQNREAQNPYYERFPEIFDKYAEKFAKLTGRKYQAFDYVGDENAEVVVVIMGSGSDVAHETVEKLNSMGYKTGVVKVRLYRPFDRERFFKVMPKTVKKVIVLDRTKEHGALGEPLYLDVVAAFDMQKELGLIENKPFIVGGIYGLSSKEFTPAMLKGAIDHVLNTPVDKVIKRFTLGIEDDVSHKSLPYDENFDAENPKVRRAKIFGFGSDGTVGASKNTIKIIGDVAGKEAQGYFVYDSKKAGGITVSHLRFSHDVILSPYLVTKPDFVGINKEEYIGTLDVLKGIQEGGTVLINTHVEPEKVISLFPKKDVETIINKKLKVYCIDAYKIAYDIGLGERINIIMQTGFFKLTGILPEDVFTREIENAIRKTYAKKGEKVVSMNIEAMRKALTEIKEVPVPSEVKDYTDKPWTVDVLPEDEKIKDFIDSVVVPVMHFEGDTIPVSKIPVDGVFPTGTTKYEKRSIAVRVPKWNFENCIQCGQCAFACPHTAIRTAVFDKENIELSNEEFETIKFNHKDNKDGKYVYRVQVFPDDCTGCGVCVTVCPGKKGNKALELVIKHEVLEPLRKSLKQYLKAPKEEKFASTASVRTVELKEPLFEFSGACPGCGETPYISLMTLLQGDRVIQANATGCSSIYGGTAPTIPYCKNERGEGPAWGNSLFEDNAEYGLGMRLAVDQLTNHAFALRQQLLEKDGVNEDIKKLLLEIEPIDAQRENDNAFYKTRDAVDKLKQLLKDYPEGSIEKELYEHISYLKYKAVWIVGGDGWAYDIGYGGLDHVTASGMDVNILVLDTEVYSNTGGQRSKATPMGGMAKFAMGGKETEKKDLGLITMSYKNVYVGSIAFGASMPQTLKAMKEAASYPGPSLLIAYSNCIEHGINMSQGPEEAKLAVETGYWLLYRFDPRRLSEKKNPLQLDSKEPTRPLRDFYESQRRFKYLLETQPEIAEKYLEEASKWVVNRYRYYKKLSEMSFEDWEV